MPLDSAAAEACAVSAAAFEDVAVIRALEAACVERVAVAVSGGPDSMALLALTRDWARPRGVHVYALTVDHALRLESAAEAAQVGQWIAQYFPEVQHRIIRRDAALIPPHKIQEQARADRYRLMAAQCQQHEIAHLLLAHHRDDQAETFLMRLCKGSGLDGLAGMKAQTMREGVQVVRPLLAFDKAALLACCAASGIPFVQDPSNGQQKFSRARLRAVQDVLAREGLRVSRLAATAMRMARARTALEFFAQQAWQAALIEGPADVGAGHLAMADDRGADSETAAVPVDCGTCSRVPVLEFDWAVLMAYPADIQLRVLWRALNAVGGAGAGYGPRLLAVEALAQQIFAPAESAPESGPQSARESVRGDGFIRATLHQCVVERSAARGRLLIRAERA